jgi:hypothetical protein
MYWYSIVPGRLHLEVGGHLDDEIGRQVPAVDEGDGSGFVFRVAFDGAAVRPRREYLALGRGKPGGVRELMVVLRLDRPRRHLL